MRKIFILLFSISFINGFSQHTYLPLGSDAYFLLDRLSTLSGNYPDTLFQNAMPVTRASLAGYLYEQKSHPYDNDFSRVDYYNINRAIANSGEWEPNGNGFIPSRHPWGKAFYQNTTNLISVDRPGFFLSVNPVLSATAIYQKDEPQNMLFSSTQGIAIRAKVKNFLGISLNVTNNYEQPVSYYDTYINRHQAMPGAAGITRAGKGYEYLLISGYLDVPLIKDYIHLTAGYDKHFIGDGIRSLFLSDFSASMPFVSINTKVWKLNYENLYMMAEPQFPAAADMEAYKHKFVSAHYLSANITRWLNMGAFESVTFSRDGGFEFGYVNPIIFYRAIERSEGSPDKVAIGLNAKAIILRRLQLYGQFLLNEFSSKDFFSNNGYMNNKWGAQLGFKYFNAFQVENLDIQGEMNLVRPYTYQHYNDGNYTNFNLPLAHPLGAGFREFIVNMRYAPAPKLLIEARAMYYEQGVDTAGENFGNDITKSYDNYVSRYGVHMVNGEPGKCVLTGLNVSYELLPNLFVDLGGTYRNYTVRDKYLSLDDRAFFINAGVRLNIARKNYWDF